MRWIAAMGVHYQASLRARVGNISDLMKGTGIWMAKELPDQLKLTLGWVPVLTFSGDKIEAAISRREWGERGLRGGFEAGIECITGG